MLEKTLESPFDNKEIKPANPKGYKPLIFIDRIDAEAETPALRPPDKERKRRHSVMSDSLRPHGLWPTRLLCPWGSPGKNTGVGCHFLLQGIFLTQGLNPGLPPCRQTLYPLSHQGSLLIQRANSLKKTLMLGEIEGRRRRGQQRMRWLASITNSMDRNLRKLQEIAEDRGAWRVAAHGVSESRTRLSD